MTPKTAPSRPEFAPPHLLQASGLTALLAQTYAHRRVLASGTLLALCGGFGATAFGVDEQELSRPVNEVRLVAEVVRPNDLAAQLEAQAAQGLTLLRSDIARPTDTPEQMLRRVDVVDPAAARFLRTDSVARALLSARGSKLVQARTGRDGQLDELVVRFEDPDSRISVRTPKAGDTLDDPSAVLPDTAYFHRLTVRRTDTGWQAQMDKLPLQAQLRLTSGDMAPHFLAGARAAQLPEVVIAQVADIFGRDIDPGERQRKDNAFSVVYETLTADGEPIPWGKGAGRVLAAELRLDGKMHTAMWYQHGDAPGGYYNSRGQSQRKAFLDHPMDYTRVSSGFSMRLHPVLKTWRQHKGVDYAAAIGTPVRTIGDGTVEFAGEQTGYGKVIKVRHSQNRTTVYAHLSQIDVRVGEKVAQGELLGESGATGWVTGPHLHFEFQQDGVAVDPQIALAGQTDIVKLPAQAMADFSSRARQYRNQLALARSMDGRELALLD
ncbi:M23 family metallopeptidase [Amphibiibacter pelophylacis]|uniref:M23 family metallopeptidase n=1 Tax=Amphibiibacter pelophylacis TaxID=1799477 RepID=A0ACC6NY24_9BURK